MEIFSALLAICAGNSPVIGEFPAQRPVTRSFDVFFNLHLNKWLSKQSCGWWFETPTCPLWCHCNGYCFNYLPTFTCGTCFKISVWCIYSAYKPSHEHHGVSIYQQPDNLFRLTTKRIPKIHIIGPLWGEPPVAATWIPSQMTSNAESVFTSWRHHWYTKSTINRFL